MRSVYVFALGVRGAPALVEATTEVFAELGWTTDRCAPATAVYGVLVDYPDWRWFIADTRARPPSLARELAQRLGAEITLHEVEVREQAHPESEEGYWHLGRSSRVGVDGVVVPLQTELDDLEPSEADFGDPHETAHTLLDMMIGAERDEGVRGDAMHFYRQGSSLTARLAELAREVRAAGAFQLTPMGERVQARVVLPDGSRRISVLTQQEVEAIVAETGITPET